MVAEPVAPGAGRAAHPGAVRDDDGRARLLDEVAGRVGSSTEARWIVDHALAAGGPGSQSGRARALAAADRRAAGEPLQYVLGTWAFRTLELSLDRRVLIPRPETEQVVDTALGELARIASARGPDGGPLVAVDLGTGSGAIALALAAETASFPLPVEVWATDTSGDALEVARTNRDALADTDPGTAGRVTFAEGSWFGALPGVLARRVDLVVSNPPYVAEEEYPGLDPVVRDWEPRSALVARRGRCGVAGSAAIEAVVAGAATWLRRSGAVVVELAPPQAYAAIDAARRAGFTRVGTARDLAGRLRMLVAER